MRLVGRIIKSFLDDECFAHSSGIAFCAILALIPMIMIMMSVTGYFLGAQVEIFKQVVDTIVGILPIGREMFVDNLQSILDQKSSFGIVGIVTLLFTATILVSSIERVLDIIFRTVKRRNFFHSRLVGIALIFGITLLFFIPTMIKVFEGLLNRFGFSIPFSGLITADVFVFVISFFSFVVGIVIIPNQKVYIRYAVIGGIVFSLGLGAARLFFGWYMAFALARYNLIYGSFTAAILLIMWIYYLSNILLLSAEIVAQVQAKRRGFSNGVGPGGSNSLN